MSGYTYTVETDHRDNRSLWRHGRENDPVPQWMADEGELNSEVFRAAAAVLAPDDAVHTAIRRAVSKVATESGMRLYGMRIAMADAVLAALKQHATGDGND